MRGRVVGEKCSNVKCPPPMAITPSRVPTCTTHGCAGGKGEALGFVLLLQQSRRTITSGCLEVPAGVSAPLRSAGCVARDARCA